MEFISGTVSSFNSQRSIDVIHYINQHIGGEISQQRKNIWQDLTSIEGKFLSVIKVIDEKPKANMSNGERLKTLPLTTEMLSGFMAWQQIKEAFHSLTCSR